MVSVKGLGLATITVGSKVILVDLPAAVVDAYERSGPRALGKGIDTNLSAVLARVLQDEVPSDHRPATIRQIRYIQLIAAGLCLPLPDTARLSLPQAGAFIAKHKNRFDEVAPGLFDKMKAGESAMRWYPAALMFSEGAAAKDVAANLGTTPATAKLHARRFRDLVEGEGLATVTALLRARMEHEAGGRPGKVDLLARTARYLDQGSGWSWPHDSLVGPVGELTPDVIDEWPGYDATADMRHGGGTVPWGSQAEESIAYQTAKEEAFLLLDNYPDMDESELVEAVYKALGDSFSEAIRGSVSVNASARAIEVRDMAGRAGH